MTTYNPDRWVLVDLITPEETIRKVFAGWYGGYANGDSWKLSSEVVTVTEHPDHYEFLNHSGSTYICHKQAYGMGGYMNSIYSSWKEQETDKMSLSIVPVDEASMKKINDAEPS